MRLIHFSFFFCLFQQEMNPERPKDPFISDVIAYYVRSGQQPVYFTIYFVKVVMLILFFCYLSKVYIYIL